MITIKIEIVILTQLPL